MYLLYAFLISSLDAFWSSLKIMYGLFVLGKKGTRLGRWGGWLGWIDSMEWVILDARLSDVDVDTISAAVLMMAVEAVMGWSCSCFCCCS